MKSIFLDFDGVIRMADVADGVIHGELSAELAREAGARIVVSSDWRRGDGDSAVAESLEPLIPREFLHPDWMTPRFFRKFVVCLLVFDDDVESPVD